MNWVIAIVGACILLAAHLFNEPENKSGNGVYYGADADCGENGHYQYNDLNG